YGDCKSKFLETHCYSPRVHNVVVMLIVRPGSRRARIYVNTTVTKANAPVTKLFGAPTPTHLIDNKALFFLWYGCLKASQPKHTIENRIICYWQ
ncbi:MAG: hypothetical protein MI751_11620, partial [Pseudomonadales bacterium]|nr:hypothetical protein [Pseudomonadales bacterium]